jgi:hypothetical protein
MLVFGALASECASLPAPANTPLHHETWQERTAANAARRTVLLAPASQVNMTSKLQLASNIADAEVAAADQAWLNSRAAAKTLADATAAARAQAEIGARASAKAAHDANKAAEAEAEVEARSASKTMDDTKSAALAVHQTNLRADSKIKSDAMSLAASEAVKETRAGTKAATDAKAQVAAASRPVHKLRNSACGASHRARQHLKPLHLTLDSTLGIGPRRLHRLAVGGRGGGGRGGEVGGRGGGRQIHSESRSPVVSSPPFTRRWT